MLPPHTGRHVGWLSVTAGDRDDGGPRRQWLPAAWSLALALLVVGPLLAPGYLLLRDAVSTPRSYPTDAALGLGDAAPRAVPQDGLLAALSTVVDGGLVVKAVLVAALWAAGWGAAVLTRRTLCAALGPQLVAATLAIWNPYVAERLLQGHWSLLTGYAALPWTALAAQRIRAHTGTTGRFRRPSRQHPERHYGSSEFSGPNHQTQQADSISGTGRAWAGLAGWFAVAGLTPTGSLLAGIVAVVVVGRRNVLGVVGLWVVAAAPWLVGAGLSGGGAEPSDPAGVVAFAARAEPGLGTLGSLVGLGGIWNGDAVPASRTTGFALVATVVLVLLVASGVRAVAAAGDPGTRRLRRALLVIAAVAVVMPALGATGWGVAVGEWLVTRVPGAGLLRDTQKYVALAVPAYTVCAAAGCRAVAVAVRNRAPAVEAVPLVAAVFVAVPLVTLPDLAWGVGGALRPVHYPAGWQRVAAAIDGPGDVAVLPAGMFRRFPFSGRVAVLDPAPRLLPRDVLQTGELPVRGRVVAGEGGRARDVERLLANGAAPGELAARGVGWVLVEKTTPGPLGASETTLAQLDSRYADADLALYRVPGPIDPHGPSDATHRALAIAAHLVWALCLLGGAVWSTARRARTSPVRR
ncbi:hypothetical protein ACFYTQ_07915 [Nocardia sp. NPDC004068]|uniref:hypothetical protein n=1 Tax=Nocardia sp. NPDC004068 TaxID=3364303 RepID=UPI003688EFC2